mgnify:CR=1 FL=1
MGGALCVRTGVGMVSVSCITSDGRRSLILLLASSLAGGLGLAAARLHACEHFHGGAGEVQRFTNIGAAGDHHAVSAPFDVQPVNASTKVSEAKIQLRELFLPSEFL